MIEAKNLEQFLKKHIMMNAAGINFTACFIIALLKAWTVNLTEIALAFPGKANRDSKYKRIQRFFADFPLDLEMIAKFIAGIIPNKNKPWVFSIDRTNWKPGKRNINILTAAIEHMGNAFPIIWTALDKRGNSKTCERIAIIKRLIKLFGIEKI